MRRILRARNLRLQLPVVHDVGMCSRPCGHGVSFRAPLRDGMLPQVIASGGGEKRDTRSKAMLCQSASSDIKILSIFDKLLSYNKIHVNATEGYDRYEHEA